MKLHQRLVEDMLWPPVVTAKDRKKWHAGNRIFWHVKYHVENPLGFGFNA